MVTRSHNAIFAGVRALGLLSVKVPVAPQSLGSRSCLRD